MCMLSLQIISFQFFCLLPCDCFSLGTFGTLIAAAFVQVSHVSQSSSQGAILSGFPDLNSSSQQKLGTAEDASGAVAAATAGENTPGQSAPCSHNAGQGAAPNAQTAALLGRSAEQLKHEWRRWQENGLFPAGAERLRPGGARTQTYMHLSVDRLALTNI